MDARRFLDDHIEWFVLFVKYNNQRNWNTNRLSFYDALIVAAAKDAQCQQLFSEDLQHGQVIDKTVTIINPFSAISP